MDIKSVLNDSGLHILAEPLIGYKKIRCVRKTKSYWTKEQPNYTIFDAIAELEIPIGSIVVRPEIITNYDDLIEKIVSHKLRTDRAIVKRIFAINSSCDNLIDQKTRYYSLRDGKFQYHIGKENIPKEPLGTDVNNEYQSGIHFFLSMSKAKDYYYL